MRRHPLLPRAALAAGAALVPAVAACGDGGGADAGGGPTVVVATTILADIASDLVGDEAEVQVVMPANADPHGFQPSARQAAEMREADLLVVNGGGFEPGLEDTVRSAADDGVDVFEAIDHVPSLEAPDGEHGAGEGDEADEGDEGGGDEGGDGHDDVDPHFFTDPARMAMAAEALADALTDAVPDLDTAAFREQAGATVADLRALDAEVERTLAVVPAERRKLVTNHDVFAYLADRYGFEVVGAVIPSVTTQGSASAGAIDELAATVRAEGVPAVFADTSSPEDLADALAREAGGVEVVALYSESLGEPGSEADTYADLMRTNATRIAEALA
jgi:zinc/manganese transport system substrate-binding protein